MKAFLTALICALILLSCVAFAKSPASTLPPKYNIIKAKIDAGQEGLVYEVQNPNIVYVTYRIADYQPATFNYAIRLFSNNHAEILDDYQVSASSGTIQLHTHSFQTGTYWINLMRIARDEEQYCAEVGFPCEVSKNLDIIRFDYPGTNKAGDEYQTFIDGAIKRSGQPVRGAAWTNR